MHLVQNLAHNTYLLILACKIIHKNDEGTDKKVHWRLEHSELGGGITDTVAVEVLEKQPSDGRTHTRAWAGGAKCILCPQSFHPPWLPRETCHCWAEPRAGLSRL